MGIMDLLTMIQHVRTWWRCSNATGLSCYKAKDEGVLKNVGVRKCNRSRICHRVPSVSITSFIKDGKSKRRLHFRPLNVRKLGKINTNHPVLG